jgi:hypothetical protein
MLDVMIVSNDVALMLVEQHGRGALDYVDDQVKAARECDDWRKLRVWYEVGDEVDKLLNRLVPPQDGNGGREAEPPEPIGADEGGSEHATPEHDRPRIRRQKPHEQAG